MNDKLKRFPRYKRLAAARVHDSVHVDVGGMSTSTEPASAAKQLEEKITELVDLMGALPAATKQIDKRAWDALMVYAPKPPDPMITSRFEFNLAEDIRCSLYVELQDRYKDQAPTQWDRRDAKVQAYDELQAMQDDYYVRQGGVLA